MNINNNIPSPLGALKHAKCDNRRLARFPFPTENPKTFFMKLSKEARQWHDQIKQEYQIEDEPGKLLLQTAFEAFDEMRKAQKEMNGTPVYIDRFGQPQEHPAAKVVRSSRTQFISALDKLKLEINTSEI